MEKDEMMPVVKDVLLGTLGDNAFQLGVCEATWDRLYPEGVMLSDEEDAAACKVFNACLDELSKKMVAALEGSAKPSLTLKEVILKHFGPGGQFFTPTAVVFTGGDNERVNEMLSIESDSCCGAGILALVWRTANTAQSYEGSARQALWLCALSDALTIYYG